MKNKLLLKIKNLSKDDKTVLKHVIGAFLVKGGSLIVSLFTMPAYLAFFNDEISLGLWFTLLSVLSWVLNFDLGIGNGLRNKLTETISQGQEEETKKYLSSAYIAIGIICISLSVVFIIAANYVNWNVVFNIENTVVSKKALTKTIKIVFIGIMLQLFFKLITSVLYAMQKSSVNNLLSLITSIITLICVLVLPSQSNEQNMICMAYIHALAVLLPLVITTVLLLFGKTLRSSLPSIRAFSFAHAKAVLSLGTTFLFVQVVYMLIMNTNEYLITLFCGNEWVTEYQIYNKLFSLGGTIFSLAMTPIWSAVTKALSQKDYHWIKKIYRLLLKLSLCGALIELFLVAFLQIFVNIWLGEQAIDVSYLYGVAFAIMGSILIFNGAISSIANGIGKLKPQVIAFTVGAMIKIPIAWLLVRLTGAWVSVVWANIAAMLFYCIWQPIILKKELLQFEKGVSDVTIYEKNFIDNGRDGVVR